MSDWGVGRDLCASCFWIQCAFREQVPCDDVTLTGEQREASDSDSAPNRSSSTILIAHYR